MQRSLSANLKLKELKAVTIPVVPAQVSLADLDEDNLMLYSENEIKQLKIIMEQIEGDCFLSRNELIARGVEQLGLNEAQSRELFRHHVVKIVYEVDHSYELFAVYRGAKSNNLLGRGDFAKVKAVQQIVGEEVGKWFALKVFQKADIGLKEASQLKELDFLISAYPRQGKKSTYHLIMNFVEGCTMYNFNNAHKSLSPVKRLRAAYDLVCDISEVHKKHILHVDIKTINVMVGGHRARLIDYSLAKKLNEVREVTSFDGTRSFSAPEIIARYFYNHKSNNTIYYSTQSDIYSLGVTLAHWFGYHFDRGQIESWHLGNRAISPKETEIPANGKMQKVVLPVKYIPDTDTRHSLVKLLEAMTHKEPSHRPTIEAIKTTIANLIASYQYLPARLNKVAIVDINECSIQDKEFCHLLKKFDEIWFCCSNTEEIEKDRLAALRTKREFEQEGYYVNNNIFCGAAVRSLLDQIPELDVVKQARDVNAYFFITRCFVKENFRHICPIRVGDGNGLRLLEQHLTSRLVDLEDKKKVEKLLQDEIARLNKSQYKTDVVTRRINTITECIDRINKIYQDNKLTYQGIMNQLDELKNSMQDHKSYLGYLPRMIQPATEGAVKIQEINDGIAESLKQIRFS